jgi:hypothetical protein
VITTCADYTVDGKTKLCSYVADAGADKGDSGSPVFYNNGDGTIWLDGVLWGVYESRDKYIFSTYDHVVDELGAMDPFVAPTYNPPSNPLSVNISGPTYIETEGAYTWEAIPDGGDGTYAYTWEFSSDGSSWATVSSSKTYSTYVSEADEPSFYLRVIVESGDGQSDIDTQKVTVAIGGCSGDLC